MLVSHDIAVAVVVVVWIPSILLLDVNSGVWHQRALGVFTWIVLVLLLRSESSATRAQIAVVVAFATVVEYAFSPTLGVYTYRLHNVPAFVPPGHGLVYLGALALGRSRLFGAARGVLVAGTVVIGGVYSFWGLFLSGRPDALGAFWFGCLVLFLWRGRQPLVYVGAFLIVTYLEQLGTALGTWAWSSHDPTGLVSMGNPPSGAAGGYGFFDAAALAAAPAIMVVIRRCRAGNSDGNPEFRTKDAPRRSECGQRPPLA
ncbi:hypothetical protein [Frankia sp. Cppng1_Ct_nod]|uniref:hypothetical protein n=1 Tax=Frankia sp. Cppng1_Ct_nod TaxID=2897162 RepID=UPI002024B55D|nr:hypothetical protein [Frankia sp. Cppng1_Ct_nod]